MYRESVVANNAKNTTAWPVMPPSFKGWEEGEESSGTSTADVPLQSGRAE